MARPVSAPALPPTKYHSSIGEIPSRPRDGPSNPTVRSPCVSRTGKNSGLSRGVWLGAWIKRRSSPSSIKQHAVAAVPGKEGRRRMAPRPHHAAGVADGQPDGIARFRKAAKEHQQLPTCRVKQVWAVGGICVDPAGVDGGLCPFGLRRRKQRGGVPGGVFLPDALPLSCP